MEVTKFVVKRSTWIRGQTNSSLYDQQTELRCCLGFLGQACGYTDTELQNRPSPGAVAFTYANGAQRWPTSLVLPGSIHQTAMTYMLMAVNDAVVGKVHETQLCPFFPRTYNFIFTLESEQQREEWLTRGFAWLGIEVVFED